MALNTVQCFSPKSQSKWVQMHHVNKFTSFQESNIVWGGISPSKLDRIFRIQKRAYKVVLGCSVDTFLIARKI